MNRVPPWLVSRMLCRLLNLCHRAYVLENGSVLQELARTAQQLHIKEAYLGIQDNCS